MAAALAPLETIRDLTLDSAKVFAPDVLVQDAEVMETTGSDGEPALVLRLLIDHNRQDEAWTILRLRLTQRIRDELIRTGDNRYPFVMVLSKGEWAKRHK